MTRKLVLTICLLSASLFGDAKIVLPDSMLTVMNAYYTNNIDTSRAIIQTMRQRQMAPKWQLDMAEADYCYATMDYTKALRLYQSVYQTGEAKSEPVLYLALLARLMQTHDMMYDEAELVVYIHELKEEAKRFKDDGYLAMADFILGKRKHYHRKKQEGLELCLAAVERMKGSNYFRKDNELCNNYADLLKMYMEDGQYDDALRMSLLQEEAVMRIKGISANNKETLRHVYAMRASLLAKAGRDEEADRVYEEWKKQPESNCIVDRPILDYLIINKYYEEAHDLIHDYCDMLRTQKDNYSYRMISMLTVAAQVEGALGDYEESAKHCREIKAIADSLHIDKSLSLMEKTWYLIQSEREVKKKDLLLTILGIVIFFGITMGGLIVYYTRLIRHRNKKLVKALNGLEAYRNMSMAPTGTTNPTAPTDEKPGDATAEAGNGGDTGVAGGNGVTRDNGKSKDSSSASDDIEAENERLFVKLDAQISRDRLFLKPNFGRDDMARLIGVDKNRIGRIMSRYSDASNASVYINTKRVEYGAKLLRKHPEYTIAAIALECGMTNTVTFNRTFKEVYGMTPSEYRENAENAEEQSNTT